MSFDSYKQSHKQLKFSDIKKLCSGDKIHVAQYMFGNNKLKKYVFMFDRYEKAGSKYKDVKYFIYGNSSYTGKLPFSVMPNGDIKFARSTDESPVYLDKPIKKSTCSKVVVTKRISNKAVSKKRVSKRRASRIVKKRVSKRRAARVSKRRVSKRRVSKNSRK